MRLILTTLSLAALAVVFTYDALNFPQTEDLQQPALSVLASPDHFTKGSAELVFKGGDRNFPVRWDLNKEVCASWQQLKGKSVSLELIETSSLGGYLAESLEWGGHKTSYVGEAAEELSRAKKRAWVWPVVFWVVFAVYGVKLIWKLD